MAKISTKRLSVRQKDWDKLKRQFEIQIASYGGLFEDYRGEGGSVISLYSIGDRKWKHKWHGSYSDMYRGIRQAKSTLKTGLHRLGILSKSITEEQFQEEYAAAFGFTEADVEAETLAVGTTEKIEYEFDENTEGTATEVPQINAIDYSGKNAYLNPDVQNQRRETVKRYFDAISADASFSQKTMQNYLQACGHVSDSRLGCDDLEFEDFGLWCLSQENIFLESEIHLKSRDVFWGIFGALWTEFGGRRQDWSIACNRYDRRDYHINKRIQLTEARSLDAGDYILGYLKNFRMSDEITVYRYFFAREDEQIRESNIKTSEEFFVQREGRGFSYSLSKSTAMAISKYWLNNHFIRKEFGDEETVRRVRESWGQRGESAIWDGASQAWIGTYKIKKSDILGTMFSIRAEEEIVAENAKLIRYETITFDDAFVSMMMRNIRTHTGHKMLILHKEDAQIHSRIKTHIQKQFKDGIINLRDLYSQSNSKIDKVMADFFTKELKVDKYSDEKFGMGILRIK